MEGVRKGRVGVKKTIYMERLHSKFKRKVETYPLHEAIESTSWE